MSLSEILLTVFCEVDEMNIPKDRDVSRVPLVCSKCNVTFRSDSEYMSH